MSLIRQNPVQIQICSAVFLTRPNAPALIVPAKLWQLVPPLCSYSCFFYTFLSLPCSLLAHRPFYYCISRRRQFLDHRPSIFLSNGPRDTLSSANSINCLLFYLYISKSYLLQRLSLSPIRHLIRADLKKPLPAYKDSHCGRVRKDITHGNLHQPSSLKVG